MASKKTKTETTIRPLGDRVLIKPLSADELEGKSASGIILPESSEKERSERGMVLAVGEGKVGDSGEVTPVSISVGDQVIFAKFGPDEIEIEDEKYLIVSESHILAVVE